MGLIYIIINDTSFIIVFSMNNFQRGVYNPTWILKLELFNKQIFMELPTSRSITIKVTYWGLTVRLGIMP